MQLRKKRLYGNVLEILYAKVLKKEFRRMRQSIKNWIRRERKAYLNKIAGQASTNPKHFWSFYSFKNKKKPMPDRITYY